MKRTEIWLINLNPTIGAEIRKTRPAIIVNDNTLGILPLKVIIPVISWKSKYSIADWMIKLEPNKMNNLNKDSAVDCFQIRSVSERRMVRKIGQVDDKKMKAIEFALAKVLKIK